MKINSIIKNFIILISIIAFLKGSFLVDFASKSKDHKDKYGVYLVFAD